jgi:hypothetical protein
MRLSVKAFATSLAAGSTLSGRASTFKVFRALISGTWEVRVAAWPEYVPAEDWEAADQDGRPRRPPEQPQPIEKHLSSLPGEHECA